MRSILQKYSSEFLSGRDLDPTEGANLLDVMVHEEDETVLAELFRAWEKKGIAEDEIFAIATVLRERCTRVLTKHDTFVDIVGTGGSKAKTFNVSTAAAFVVAGAGVPVAKHGNRAATSSSGSADVLADLGVEPSVDAATATRCLDDIGICFMFAPNFHRLSPTLAKVRRGLGFPTIFNCVGPLCNPANAPHQVIGVWSDEMVPRMANALARLGTKKSWVVHGKDGLDEISSGIETIVAEVTNGSVRTFAISPEHHGVKSSIKGDIRTTSVQQSSDLIRALLGGSLNDHPAETMVALNAAAALLVTGSVDDIREGFAMALESIRSGSANRKLRDLSIAAKNE